MIGKFLISSAIGLSLLAGNFSLPAVPEKLNSQVKKELPKLIDTEMESWSTKVRTIGPSYKVYSVNLANIETLDPKTKDAVASIISEEYIWEWLLLDAKGKVVGVAIAEKWEEDNTWDVVLDIYGDSSDMLEIANDSDRLIKYLAKIKISDISDIKRFRMDLLGDFIYVDSSQGQYIIPLNEQPSRKVKRRAKVQWNLIFPNLEGGKAYRASEALAEIIEWKVNSPNVISDDGGNFRPRETSSSSLRQPTVPVEKKNKAPIVGTKKVETKKVESKKVANERGLLPYLVGGVIAISIVSAIGIALRRRF